MNLFTAEAFAGALALIGVVIITAALLSGVIERSGLPQVAVFLGLGLIIGPYALGLFDVDLSSPVLRVVGTLSLALVLFTDALALNIPEVRRHAKLAARVLGPGTLLSAALIALVGWKVLSLPATSAVILGAALASTDPVLLRGLLKRRNIPASARQALQLESGLNDVVLLPIVVIAMALAGANSDVSFGKLMLQQFVLGPGAGVLTGIVSIAALDFVRRRVGVRRDYESLYSLGVAFTAFAAAEAVHGSGFLAAFAAGLTIAWLDVELCDCFLDYGGATAEMLLLFTFVLFGTSLIWTGLGILSVPVIIFAALVLLVRPPVYWLSLMNSGVDKRGRALIAWFGPRGLSSLLLVLLPVFAGVAGSEQLFTICAFVVLLSVVIHGGSPLLLTRFFRDKNESDTASDIASSEFNNADDTATKVDSPATSFDTQPSVTAFDREANQNGEAYENDGLARDETPLVADRVRVTIEELRRLQQVGEQVIILDVRTVRSRATSEMQAAASIRIDPDDASRQVAKLKLPPGAWLAAYCA